MLTKTYSKVFLENYKVIIYDCRSNYRSIECPKTKNLSNSNPSSLPHTVCYSLSHNFPSLHPFPVHPIIPLPSFPSALSRLSLHPISRLSLSIRSSGSAGHLLVVYLLFSADGFNPSPNVPPGPVRITYIRRAIYRTKFIWRCYSAVLIMITIHYSKMNTECQTVI